MLEECLEVDRNQDRAIELYKKSSRLGHATSSLKLAKVYSKKYSNGRDQAKALHYLKIAIEKSENKTIRHTLENVSEITKL
ncbi:hypothetical protein Misp06_01369 [Microbulbifer sp. NBRC 101763]